MTTTSSTTATSSTAAATTTSTLASAGSSILTSLNAGSGIDTSSLTTNLTQATFSAKEQALSTKETNNTAQISSLGTLTGGIDSFASALSSLVSGGTLNTQVTSSDSTVLTATAQAGASISNLSSQIEVRQIAQAQSLVSAYLTNSGSAIGTGTLTLNNGTTNFTVTIDSTNNTLAGLARAINATSSGVTASIVTDSTGARLVLKGATGAANAFTLTASAGADASLQRFTSGASGMTLSGSTVSSASLTDATTASVGQGSFTLTNGGTSKTLTIDSSNDNLNGLASAITGAGLGLTANVVTDSNGAHLEVTNTDGSTPSFTLAPASDAQAGLSRFAYGTTSTTGMTTAQAAQDAIIRMDGVNITRATNTVSDVVPGVTLSLVAAKPGTTISLSASVPTAAISQAVSDFVGAYNTMKAEIATATAAPTASAAAGPLYGNTAIQQMMNQLAKLSSTVLNSSGGPSSLAEIGVSTNLDGTLSLNSATLTTALQNYPDAVEAMFNPTQHSSSPLIKITSAMGAVAPGTYAVSGVTAQTSTSSAQATFGTTKGITTGSTVYASVTSSASGLVIEPQGDVASATITVDPGLGGALKAIRDALRATNGALDTLSTQLTDTQKDLATQRTTLQASEDAYSAQLTTQFTAMTTRVSNYNSIKSYLTQQVAVWTKSTN
ncbi:flagellar filament capping protein FliD [Sphingomonas nostoxanthinifaciens]|uniref:flagellar filament capping protein FliD n=1 Tax=Sphingomonas nostoxanthinifaciens TaxID=2872652 RepID=UPI001CC20206|nr:flagellar filament capping protein FliD [Sphingomonas nostoxanthinifaciens]UAK22976.1 flagellar filament capping protein FliD [Sphingomonas nostoxanthinifaciens]